MALQDVEPATETLLGDFDTAAEFEAGLVELMPFLRAFAQSLSRRAEHAEDLAQEALAKAWRSRHSFTKGSNLKVWLFTILRNEYYSQQRRAWRQSPWDEELVDTLGAPSEAQQWAVELSDTARAMHGLTDAQREVLILVGAPKLMAGFPYKQRGGTILHVPGFTPPTRGVMRLYVGDRCPECGEPLLLRERGSVQENGSRYGR
jgi:RNA polymerase sigma-70 factor (ECF subfamily)